MSAYDGETGAPDPAARRDQISAGLAGVRARIERACAQAGRDPGELTLVVVTKTFPAADVLTLADLGVRDVGENRDQEASAKKAEVVAAMSHSEPHAPGDDALRWHCVGRLQTNKARSVADWAAAVHSVDSPRLARALAKGVAAIGRDEPGHHLGPLDVLVQISLDGDGSRGGALADQVDQIADVVVDAPGLALRGVMAVAPLGADPMDAFAELAKLSGALRERHSDAAWISAGMSGDLEAAISNGATHLRVGGAVLGNRTSVK